MGYHMPSMLSGPALNEELARAEKELGFELNDALKELYRCANGITRDYETASGLTGILPIHDFLSLTDAVTHYQELIDLEESFTDFGTGFKPGKSLFPFLDDGAGNCYWVDLNTGTANENRIYWTNTFGQDPCYHYEFLQNMFAVIAEAYEKDIFSLDEDGYLDADYSAFHELSGKYNQEVEYWK